MLLDDFMPNYHQLFYEEQIMGKYHGFRRIRIIPQSL